MSDTQLAPLRHPEVVASSSTVAQVCAALATAQAKFRNPKRTKTATVRPRDGSVGYTFAYAPLEEVIDAVKDGLAENGLLRYQRLVWDEQRNRDAICTIIWHTSGEWLDFGNYPVFYGKEGAQGFAGGVTYAKRQGLSLALGISPEDDDDGNVGDGNVATIKPTRQPKPPAANVMQQQPHDLETGEVLQAVPVSNAANEALEARAALLSAAAMGKGGKPAEAKLREAWAKTPQHIQDQLRPRTKEWLQIARDVDQAHAMAQEQQR